MLNYHVCLITFLYGSNHAEYTQENQLMGDESKCHENKKGSCGQKQTLPKQRMEAIT